MGRRETANQEGFSMVTPIVPVVLFYGWCYFIYYVADAIIHELCAHAMWYIFLLYLRFAGVLARQPAVDIFADVVINQNLVMQFPTMNLTFVVPMTATVGGITYSMQPNIHVLAWAIRKQEWTLKSPDYWKICENEYLSEYVRPYMAGDNATCSEFERPIPWVYTLYATDVPEATTADQFATFTHELTDHAATCMAASLTAFKLVATLAVTILLLGLLVIGLFYALRSWKYSHLIAIPQPRFVGMDNDQPHIFARTVDDEYVPIQAPKPKDPAGSTYSSYASYIVKTDRKSVV